MSQIPLDNNTKICYTYDDLSRVTKRTLKDCECNVLSEETFTYDAAGNVTNADNTAYVYDTNNRLTSYSGKTVTYDADGNMTSDGTNTYTYDSANRLSTAGGHAYTYTAEDVRIKDLCNNVETQYTYDTNCKLSKLLLKVVGTTATKYVYGLGLIGEESNSTFKTYHFDYRGSTVAITNASGTVTDTFEYDTYGKQIARTGTSSVIFGYNGRDGVVTDSNGLLYMRARYYSPELRRFINADIIPGEISNAVTLNRYAYTNGNPVSNVDPFGLSAEDKTKGTSQSAIIPEVNCSDDGFWDSLANYFGSAWDDVKSYIITLYEYGLKRRSQEMIEDFNLYTFTNWLTLGLVEGLDIRSQAMLNDPNLYTVSNWLTLGAVDSIKGAFNPDKPLSVQHWVDSFNTVCILFPIAYKSIEVGTSALNRLSARQQAPVTLNPADVKRIQNATNKTGQQIIVVGSRANGTATVFSDWDYYMTGNSAQRHAAISSLPRGIWGGQNNTGIDVYVGYPNSKYYEPLITSKPHIIFSPKE